MRPTTETMPYQPTFTTPALPSAGIEIDAAINPMKNATYYCIIFIYFGLLFISFAANINLLIALFRGRKVLLKIPFYFILLQVGMINMICTFSIILGDTPMVILLNQEQAKTYIGTNFYSFVTGMEIFYEHSVQWFILMMTLYRVLVMSCPHFSDRFLSLHFFMLIFLLVWLLMIFFSAYLITYNCSFKIPPSNTPGLDPNSIAFMTEPVQLEFNCAFTKIYFIEKFGFSSLNLISYVFLGFKLYQARKITGRSYQEKSIVQQGLVMFLLTQISIALYYITAIMPLTRGTVYNFRKIMLMADMLAGAAPILFIMYTNKEIRRYQWTGPGRRPPIRPPY